MTNDLRVPQSLWRFQASFMPQESLKEVLSERISSSMAGGGDVLGDWGGSLPIRPVGGVTKQNQKMVRFFKVCAAAGAPGELCCSHELFYMANERRPLLLDGISDG